MLSTRWVHLAQLSSLKPPSPRVLRLDGKRDTVGHLCLLAGAEQEGPAHNRWSTHPPYGFTRKSLVATTPTQAGNGSSDFHAS